MRTGDETTVQQVGVWTLRYRPAPSDTPRLLLLLHGWTGDENSMWVFTHRLPRDYALLALRAPYPASEGGFSWRFLPPLTWGFPKLDELRPAADSLLDFVTSWEPLQDYRKNPIALMGFSQGAALAIGLTLLHPGRFSAAAVLSGFLPEGSEKELVPGRLAGVDFFVSHGREDELVPVERARRTVLKLREAGARVSFCETDGGHKVSSGCLKAVGTFFSGQRQSTLETDQS